MSDSPPAPTRAYSITVDFLYELIEEAEQQVVILKLLLQDFLDGSVGNEDIFITAVEILWANNSLLKLLDQEIETAVLQKNKKTGEEEFLLVDTSMQILQQLILSKYYATMDLRRRSYSISLH